MIPFPRADESSLVLSLLVAGIVTVSCDEDVREVDEAEELVDKPGTTNGTLFDVSQCIFLPFFDEMWFLATSSNGNCTQILRRVFQVKELPVYFQEALPSRISPIL